MIRFQMSLENTLDIIYVMKDQFFEHSFWACDQMNSKSKMPAATTRVSGLLEPDAGGHHQGEQMDS